MQPAPQSALLESLPTSSTATGNYALPELPVGNYELTVSVAGFKKYVRRGLEVQAAQTYRIDVSLEVGQATESVTVSAPWVEVP